MSRPVILFKKYAILTHRWMGVLFCVLFAVWFVSGIVMMYWDFPQVRVEDRLAKEQTLDASQIKMTPAEAYTRLEAGEAPDQVRLVMLEGHPVYRFAFRGTPMIIKADSGELIDEISRETGLRIAAAWAGQPPESATVDLVREVDQWSIQVRRQLPLWKATFASGDEVYVSRGTGEVAQHTTRGSRMGAYFGAIPHWLYFTPLRQRAKLWTDTVVWLSLLGVFMNLFGLVVGVWMYSPSKRYRLRGGASSIPYSGQKHWHTILGLLFGLFAFTWVLSGMFSMNPWNWSPGFAPGGPADPLRAGKWNAAAFAMETPAQALAKLPADFQTKELRLTYAASAPTYIALAGFNQSRAIPVGRDPIEHYDPDMLRRLMASATRPQAIIESRVVTQYEPYYIDRQNRRPLPALFVQLNDAEQSMYYVDLKTAQVVQAYNKRSRMVRWLYHGLHSLDLPWLYKNRPAWDITVMILMLGGTALCVTSVVIGWRRLRRKVQQVNVVLGV